MASPRVRTRWKPVYFTLLCLLRTLLCAGQEEGADRAASSARVAFSLEEGQPPGTFVGNIPTQPGFTYRFNQDPGIFSLDASSGEIRTTQEIDREALSDDSLDLVVLSSLPTYPIEVRIDILDINDNSPIFPDPSIEISFSESARTGSQVILDTATDADIGGNDITDNYRIVSGNANSTFALVITTNPSGEASFLHLQTNQNLDREIRSSYQLNISAQDGGSPPRYGYLLVNISVRDSNDNPPIFDQSEYIVSLNESAPVGTSVLTVRATDIDEGTNAEITYLLDSGEPATKFQIDPRTGVVTTLQELDYEESDNYYVNVQAHDNGSPIQYGRAYITINLVDENDHDPAIGFRYFPIGAQFASVEEDAALNTVVTLVTITDADQGSNGDVDLEILSGNEQGTFQVTHVPGLSIVKVARSLDREITDQYNLTMRATDHGNPPRRTIANLIIYVNDINDHAPMFERTRYNTTLSERVPIGSYVQGVTATDDDSGLNAQVRYAIVSGNEHGWFTIDGNTGLVTTQADLDHEVTDGVILNISASDQGISIQFTAYTQLTITIIDENDFVPTFSESAYNVTVLENQNAPREVITVTAQDDDQGTNGEVYYEFDTETANRYSGIFQLNSNTGRIDTLVTFDREMTDLYLLVVGASDRGNPPQQSAVRVNVIVGDLNDNNPVFYPVRYYASIRENQPSGTSVVQVSASDLDASLNGRVTYQITRGNPDGKFTISPQSGQITTTAELDREVRASYQLEVTARDGTGQSSTSPATIDVTVVDIQDNPPEFSQPGYNFVIFENVEIGKSVGMVSATFRDANANATYSIFSGDPAAIFRINAETGLISTAKEVDREQQPLYQLYVVASGGRVVGQTQVNVTLRDLNDNPPSFPTASAQADAVENWPVGREVYEAAAQDPDDGVNAQITYELITNPSNRFQVNGDSGIISLTGALSYEVGQYVLELQATDRGLPPQSATMTLTVTVRDVNDHAPVFSSSSYSTAIPESRPVNDQFFSVTATDEDAGLNGLISYSITGGNPGDRFGVFPDGNLYIRNALDREVQSRYVLSVEAQDNGVEAKSAVSNVTVEILDENDNRPLFANATYNLFLDEEAPAETMVALVTAVDRDAGTNAELRYSFITEQSDFAINPSTGAITSLRMFDREDLIQRTGLSTFTLEVAVTDSGDPPLQDRSTLQITVRDINDNVPRFAQDTYQVSISETALRSQQVVRVSASDMDYGNNALVRYTITEGNDDGKFLIDSSSGQITLAQLLDREVEDFYSLLVDVRDSAAENPLSSQCRVNISVLDENDNEPVFSPTLQTADVLESTRVNDLITTLTATDGDAGANGEITYSISGGNAHGTFSLDSYTGKLYLAKALDYESTSLYRLNITASDHGTPLLSTVIPFEINVLDSNDNPPTFPPGDTVRQITEGVGLNTVIATVTATDPDSGSNGDIRYSIASQVPQGDQFAVNPTSGEVFTRAEIDREFASTFDITVRATDQAIPVSERRHAFKVTTVIIRDVNDNNPLFVSQDAAAIAPSASSGDVVLNVVAEDPDEGTNGEVRYAEVSGSTNQFAIGGTTGVVTLAQNLSPSQTFYTLVVSATDQGPGRRSSTSEITFFMTSTSSNGPTFSRSSYSGIVHENQPVGTSITSVRASYSDGHSATIEYYITSIRAGATSVGRYFAIGRTTGRITTGVELDREEGYDSFTLEVYVVDKSSSSPRTQSTQVTITLEDENDNAPLFDTDYRDISIPEDLASGGLVTTVVANDADVGTNAIVLYSIIAGDDGQFRVDSDTGEIRTTGRLNREQSPTHSITVQASDGQQASTVDINISLTDVNDNAPQFLRSVYSFDIREDAAVNSEVNFVSATDADEGNNADITYSITDENQGMFDITPNTGVIILRRPLDYEQTQHYVLTVQAQDGGGRASSVTVYVNVKDLNDNPPVFDPERYTADDISEDVPAGTSILTVSATDRDEGPNAEIDFSIVSGDPNDQFSIQSDGTIVTAAALDREQNYLYNLVVMATDRAIPAYMRLSSTAQVEIIVNDINDNPPRFVTPNVTSVYENSPVNTIIMTIRAEDPDEERNSYVEYSMASIPGNKFILDSVTGQLRVNGDLDREATPSYVVTVTATDKGRPPMSVSMDLTINLLDRNDNNPVFGPVSYDVSVLEDVAIGTELVQVVAADVDEGTNGVVRYSIVSGNTDNDLAINAVTGRISVARLIDHERTTGYSLVVRARDQGATPLEALATVTITVTDVNDYVPLFLNSPFVAHVMENNNNVPQFVTQISAQDEDSGTMGQVDYYLPDDKGGKFSITSSDGRISLLRTLDREDQSEFLLAVLAEDRGSPRLTGTGTVRVLVDDINDNTPTFDQQTYTTTIAEDVPVNTDVLLVSATDLDAGENGNIRYTLTGDLGDKFEVNPSTGQIITIGLLDRETQSLYTMVVTATDSSASNARSSSATVMVTVSDVDDNVPAFLDRSIDAYLPDNAPTGTFVALASATDPDEGTNGDVRYSLSGSDANRFSINQVTGVISTAMTLSDSQYNLQVTASDLGPNPGTDTASVTINFQPAASFPSISVGTDTFNYPETQSVGTVLTSVQGSSSKPSPADAVTYHIAGGNEGDVFEVNPSGQVRLRRSLNYEETSSFNLWMEARDSDTPALSRYHRLRIALTDVNDNPPIFSQNPYVGSVGENEGTLTSVLTVSASDADSGLNGQFEYRLRATGNLDNSFQVNPNTGQVSTRRFLDREQRDSYTLVVEAVDKGSPTLTGTATVLITVEDKNDNPMQFRNLYSTAILEDTPIGSFVIQVSTTDPDIGTNAMAQYKFSLDSQYAEARGKFNMGRDSGNVTVASTLDREISDHYELLVIAEDSAWEANTPLSITILDVNDNPPRFSAPVFERNLPEGIRANQLVTRLVATDEDEGTNAEVFYRMKTLSNFFRLDESSGAILTKNSLEFVPDWTGTTNPNHHQFVVIATDRGTPPLSGEVTVIINVIDANDHAPVFQEVSYFSPVPENAQIGEMIIQVYAVDNQDIGSNAEVEYSITGGNGTNPNLFIIDRTTGWVSVSASLSGRQNVWYSVTVQARDQGSPALSTTTDVSILVTDVNVYAPGFSAPSYQVTIEESRPMNSHVFTVVATDRDAGLNGEIRYSIVGGDDYGQFYIDPQTGSVTVARVLDYETTPTFHLNISARDRGLLYRESFVILTVDLTDVNDNDPMFDPATYDPSIPENSPSGTSVVMVTATDADTGANAAITYQITGGDGRDLFIIDPVTGEITSQGGLDYERKQMYTLQVTATNVEASSRFGTCTVNIHLSGQNEYAPVFLQRLYTFEISESAETGTTVGTVYATDRDDGTDGIVNYILVGSSNDKGFAIGLESGAITVARRLDRETSSHIILSVISKNRGSILGNDIDEVQVNITIIDANDPPVFEFSLYEGHVSEGDNIGTSVLTVSAIDNDLRADFRSFVYGIQDGNEDSAFSINQNSGIITTASRLDRETIDTYNLTVTATDSGIPPATGTTYVVVNIDDINDNGPEFVPPDVTGYVLENRAPTTVMTLSATDPDLDPNRGPFSYRLIGGHNSQYFTLDQSNGRLSTTRLIDREQQSDFYLIVETTDSGSPSMSSTHTVHIVVEDVNDNPSTPRTVDIYIHSQDGSFPPGPIGNVHPVDPDVGDTFSCTIIQGNTEFFSIPSLCNLNTETRINTVRDLNLRVSGDDGVHPSVVSTVSVHFREFTSDAVTNGIIVRLNNITASDFLKNSYTNFISALNDIPGVYSTVLYSMENTGEDLDIVLAIQQTNQQFMVPQQVSTAITNRKANIESRASVSIVAVNFNPCDDSPCQHGGVCSKTLQVTSSWNILESNPVIFVSVDTGNRFTCSCPTGYTGESCEIEINECDATPCLNGGTCTDEIGTFSCECPPGYHGNRCQNDVDECSSNPCRNGGQCLQGLNDYTCSCAQGYTGKNCEIDVDYCISQPCLNNGTCTDGRTSYSCQCGFGEKGDNCEITSYGFEEVSYMQFPVLDQRNNDIMIEFATVMTNALLLYNYDAEESDTSDFIVLEIIAGKLRLSYQLGDGITRIGVEKNVADGQWHTVTARRNGKDGTLIVDNCGSSSPAGFCRNTGGTGTASGLDLSGLPMMLGGVQTIDAILVRPGQVSSNDFVGCIREVTINGVPLNLAGPLSSRGISDRCPRAAGDVCLPDPCKNGAACQDKWSGHQCQCSDIYVGDNCDKRRVPFSFGGNSFVEFQIKESYVRQLQLGNQVSGRRRRANQDTSLSLKFRTRENSGLLLYAGGSTRYTVLEVKAGKLVYSYNAGSGHRTREMDVAVTNGLWHKVTLVRRSTSTSLFLQNEEQTQTDWNTEITGTTHDFLSSDVATMSVGGTNTPVTIEGQTLPGFDGCVDELRLNGQLLPFVGSNDIVIATPSENVDEGCPSPPVCVPNPCPNNLLCIDQWLEYECSAPGACGSSPCKNNGTCIPNDSGFRCRCDGNYNGTLCENALACIGFTCGTNEVCVGVGATGRACQCVEGFSGDNCEIKLPHSSGTGLHIGVIIVIVFFCLVAVIILIAFIVYHRRRMLRKKEQLPKTAKQNGGHMANGGQENRAYNTDDIDSVTPYLGDGMMSSDTMYDQKAMHFNEREVKMRDPTPDIIERGRGSVPIDNMDDDDVVIENDDGITALSRLPEDRDAFPEHYDLENASSIAPSDIDVTYQAYYKAFREGKRYKQPVPNRHNHHPRQSPSSLLHQVHMRDSPNHLARKSPNHLSHRDSPSFQVSARQSPASHLLRQSPNHLARQSPASHLEGPMRPLGLRTTSDHLPPSEHGSHYSGSSMGSKNRHRAKSPCASSHGRGSRPSSRLKQPIEQIEMDSGPPVGLSVEEVEMLNARPRHSVASTMDGASSITERTMPVNDKIMSLLEPPDLLEPPESSTEESQDDSFTCSEFEYEREKPLRSRSDFDPRTNKMFPHGDNASFGGSLSTLLEGDDPQKKQALPPNGTFSWDYLLNWGPNFENLVGVFSDIAALPPDAQSRERQNSDETTTKVNGVANNEEYV